MKQSNFIYRSVKATTVLFAAIVLSLGFSACADSDTVNTPTAGQAVVKDLVGTWQANYSKRGQVTMKNGQTWTHTSALQALTFNADGTGTCTKFLCNVAGEPLSMFGGEGDAINGRFHYTVGNDSTITITRDGDGDADNPKTWQLRFGVEGLEGSDGASAYQMESASDKAQAYITNLEKNYRSGANAEIVSPFLTDWQHQQTVKLSGIDEPQYTPWAGKSSKSIVDAIRFDVQKEAGWEMGFCALNDPNSKNTHLFGLYNRYTGILRVFSYVDDAGSQNYGNGELGYMFSTDYTNTLPRYLFYNSMEYAIPVCHDYNNSSTFAARTPLKSNNGELSGTYYPFETIISAYSRTLTVSSIDQGWHCADFDFSGYSPDGIHWTDGAMGESTLIDIKPSSQKTSEVSLLGSIVGNLSGTFVDPQYYTETSGNSSLSAATGVFNSLTQFANGLFTTCNMYNMATNAKGMKTAIKGKQEINDLNIKDIIAKNGVYKPARAAGLTSRAGGGGKNFLTFMFGTSILFSATSCALNIANQFEGQGKGATTMVNPGHMSLTLDADIDMSGTIKEWASINDAGVSLTPNSLKECMESKDTTWMGSGCFGLVDDPVIYVSSEDLLSVSNTISLDKNKDGSFSSPSWDKDSVRLVQFLDPTSVKVLLNTDVYHDIDSVNITVNYGIITSRDIGNTDCYRNMLKLDARPEIKLQPNSDRKLTTTTPTRLHVMSPFKAIQNDYCAQALSDSVKLDYQEGVLPLYGRFDTQAGKRILLDPQVFAPYVTDSTQLNNTIYNPIVPDFVVNVGIGFTCRECPNGVTFTKLYIPKIVVIGHDQLKEKYDMLSDYADKCDQSQQVDVLYSYKNGQAQPTNIPVYNELGKIILAKSLDVLKKCY